MTISTVEPSAIENEFLYHVSNESEIVLALEESSVQLRLMLGTSGLAKGLQGQIESLVVTCRQLEEVFSLLMQCQHLVMDPFTCTFTTNYMWDVIAWEKSEASNQLRCSSPINNLHNVH